MPTVIRNEPGYYAALAARLQLVRATEQAQDVKQVRHGNQRRPRTVTPEVIPVPDLPLPDVAQRGECA